MKFRRATLADTGAIIDLAVESVSKNPIAVRVDREAMREMAIPTISSNKDFVWVGEVDGTVVSCLAACVLPSFWYRGGMCSVLLFYSRAPGGITPLMRKFAAWLKARPGVKVGIFELEPEADPRIQRVLARLGFDRKSVTMTYVRKPA